MLSKRSFLLVLLILILFPNATTSAKSTQPSFELEKEFIDSQIKALEQYVLEASLYGSFNSVEVIPIYIEGKRKDLELVRNDEGRILFPLNGILQEFGGSMNDDGGQWKVSYDNSSLVLTPSSVKAILNGEAIQLDTPPYESEASIHVSVKLLKDLFHLNIYWVDSDRAIYISEEELLLEEADKIQPIVMTSIQVGNDLLDGYMVGETQYGFLHELLVVLGAVSISGCTELVIIYEEKEYMIDLVSGIIIVDGETKQLRATPFFIGSEIIIPLDWLSEVLDIKVEFLEEHNTVLVLPYYE